MSVTVIANNPSFDPFMTKNASKVVVIDFFADWCGPCRAAAPHFEALAKKYPDVAFAKVNVDVCDAIAERYGIRSLPSFRVFVNKAIVDKVDGADLRAVEAMILKHRDAVPRGAVASWGAAPAPASVPAGPHTHPAARAPAPAPAPATGGELTSDQKDKIRMFTEVTGCARDRATRILAKRGWDLDLSVIAFLSDPTLEAADVPAAPELTRESSADRARRSAPIWEDGHGPVPATTPATATATGGGGGGGGGGGIATGTGAAAVADADAPKANIQFRLDASRVSGDFPASARVRELRAYVASCLPPGTPFALYTRRGGAEVPLNLDETLTEAGLAPRGLVLVKDTPAKELVGGKKVATTVGVVTAPTSG